MINVFICEVLNEIKQFSADDDTVNVYRNNK